MRDPSMAETLTELRTTDLLAAALVALASLPLAIWAVRRWVRPLRNLVDAATRLGEGHAPPPVCADTGDEIGLLATTFNTMAQKLFSALEASSGRQRRTGKQSQTRTRSWSN